MLLSTMKRRCKTRKGGHRSFEHTSTTSTTSIDLDERDAVASTSGQLTSSSTTARGHCSDDDCKRRRKENRKQLKREKRQAKQEARKKRQSSTAGANTTSTVEHEEQQEDTDDTPRSETEGGSWISTSLPVGRSSSLLGSSDTTSDDSELSAQHQAISTTSASWPSDFSSAEPTTLSRSGGTSTSTIRRTSSGGGKLDFLSGVHVPASISNIGEAKRVEVRRVHLLYNPWSGNKKGERKMRKARRLLEREGKEVTVTKLLHKGHAEELCASMDLTGIDVLCSVGGDGTFHECVNGIMKRINKAAEQLIDDDEEDDEEDSETRTGGQREHIPPLAFIAAGTGNSFVHELGCVRTRDAVRHICRGIEVGVDLNRLRYGDEECYSFNSIHWGIGSRVVDTAERFRWMGNSARYIMAALVELVKGNNGRVRMLITDENDEEVVLDEAYALGIANTIITAGKGMKMAPTAKIDDGLIDLLLFTSTAPKDLLAVLRRFYNGTHVDLPHVHYLKAKKFTIIPYKPTTEDSESGEESKKGATNNKKGAERRQASEDDITSDIEAKEWFDDQTMEITKEVIDIDGELKGFTPFSCEVLPRAIQVIL